MTAYAWIDSVQDHVKVPDEVLLHIQILEGYIKHPSRSGLLVCDTYCRLRTDENWPPRAGDK